MGKHRKGSASGNDTASSVISPNILGDNLENIPSILDSLYTMDDNALMDLVGYLENNIIHYLKKGDNSGDYYELSNGTIIPHHKGLTGTHLLEDYTGDTYQNEYYRQLHQFLSDVEFELYERDIPYELVDNPIPDSVVPVIVRD